MHTATARGALPSLVSVLAVCLLASAPPARAASAAPQNGRGASAASGASGVTPERMGFEAGQVAAEGGAVRYFVSTEGRPLDRSRRLPLLVFLQGSGSAPIFYGKPPRLGRSTLFNPKDFPGYHYVVLAKPGIPFHDEQRSVVSDEYDRRTCLSARVDAVDAVVGHLVQQPWIDVERVVLLGHSEGADVAPWAAAQCQHVTHVVALAPGALSQLLEFTIMERKKAARGEQTAAATEDRIRRNRDVYRAIFRDPQSWKKKWRGHTYLRWSSFAEPAMAAYRRLAVPILAISGRDDRNTPVESGEALELEFLRTGKGNLTFEVWPVNHYLREGRKEAAIDRRADIGKRILQWLRAASRAPSVGEVEKRRGR